MKEEKPDSKEKSTVKRSDYIKPYQFKKGQSGNPKGYPVGKPNYKTLYKRALIKIAEKENISPEEVEVELIANAIEHGKKGNYQFYKDVLDRNYGPAKNEQSSNQINLAMILNGLNNN
jgi:hypothetical protein